MKAVLLYDALGQAMRLTGHKRTGFPRCQTCDRECDYAAIEDKGRNPVSGRRFVEARVRCHDKEDSFRFQFDHNAGDDIVTLAINDHVWFPKSHWEK